MQAFRTDQVAEFVHRQDPKADLGGKDGPDEQWLDADGQPLGAERYGVRALNADEWREVSGLPGADQGPRACDLGLRTIDGKPATTADISFGASQEIGSLVVGLTLRPMSGRSSISTGIRSKGSTATRQSGKSRSRKKK